MLHVVSDTLTDHNLLLGTNFLDTVEISIKNGEISVRPVKHAGKINDELPEIFQIDITNNKEVDVFHKSSKQTTIAELISNYKPEKTKEIPVKMSIVVKDEDPVYQRAR